ncbi:nitroreductase family protein [Streptomyces lydicus]|uniref:nitroreductase family protein n=1 Tax=Streptomyces lydicus TaxID=47763 RepID=UPI00371E7036
MDIHDAVTNRRAVRGFTDQPVPRETLERVLSAGAWVSSGTNVQPWHAYKLNGALLSEFKKRAGERASTRCAWPDPANSRARPPWRSLHRAADASPVSGPCWWARRATLAKVRSRSMSALHFRWMVTQ